MRCPKCGFEIVALYSIQISNLAGKLDDNNNLKFDELENKEELKLYFDRKIEKLVCPHCNVEIKLK